MNCSICGLRERRLVDHPSRRFPAAIDAPKRQATWLEAKKELVSAYRARLPMHEGEQCACPRVGLRGHAPRAVDADVMAEAFGEHDYVTPQVAGAT
jgi:hypothetical protein